MAMEGPVTRSEMQAFELMVNTRFTELEQRLTARADTEILSLGEKMKVTIGDIVEGANKGFADEQSRIQNAMSEAAKNFAAEQVRIEQMLESVASNLRAVDVQKVEAMAALIEASQANSSTSILLNRPTWDCCKDFTMTCGRGRQTVSPSTG